MTDAVTIWNTHANDGAGAIAARPVITGYTDPVGEEAPEPIYGDPIVLERIAPGQTVFGVKWSSWARPTRSVQHRADPASYGMDNFKPGEAILDDLLVTPSLSADEVRGALGDTPVVDLEAGTATWTYAVAAKPLATRKGAMIAAVKGIGPTRVAEGFKYTIPGSGQQHTYQVDLESQSHMMAIFVELLDGVENPHDGYWRNAANVNVTMSDVEIKAFLHAAKTYKMAIIRRAQALVDAIVAAADHDALDLINTTTGAIDGDGAWPTNNG